MQWGSIRDRIVEAKDERSRCWIKLDIEGKVISIYVKTTPESISKFFPDDEWEETLEGAKFRAEFEIERFFYATQLAKLQTKIRV
jgi:hypothetical protein